MDSIELARRVREISLETVTLAKASHIGSALSIVDILSVLYSGVMNYSTNNVSYANRDRFILSKGHACIALYATLCEVGFFERHELNNYGGDFSIFMNHVSHHVPGVEFSTGSLGHGLPFAVGKAMTAKIQRAKWKTYVILSDGELDEGSNWEALMFAAHHKLDNLVAIIDYNKLQSLTSTENTLGLEPLKEKFEAFNCKTLRVDGHDHNELNKAFAIANNIQSQPIVIIADTIKGKGVSFMENKVEWHYKSPSNEELAIALKELSNA